MNNIIRAFKFVFQFSILGYQRNRSYPLTIKLDNIQKYWKFWLKNTKLKSNHILVDALIFHPKYLANNFTIANVLRKKFNAEVTALIKYSSEESTKFVSKHFFIDKFACIYIPINLAVILNAIIHTIISMQQIMFSKYNGISVFVDGCDIGEYIYDEYLRVTSLPTKRKITIDYIAFIYRSLYIYFRYKQILLNYNISHVAFGHNVYATWGLLLPAAKATNSSIKFYNWYDASREGKITVTKQQASCKIRKAGYMKQEYLSLLMSKHGEEKILRTFNFLMQDKLSGKLKDRDSSNAYECLDIDTIDKFIERYSMVTKSKHIFIYSHAFVDAVKYPRWTIYADYYTWLEETLIQLAKKTHITNIYVKPHPSEHLYPCKTTSKILTEQINKEHNAAFVFLDKKVSNSVIFEIADAIITCSGTVNIEASCFGIPCILAGEFGNEMLRYTYVCRDERDYFETLDMCESLPKLTNQNTFIAKLYFYWFAESMFVDSNLFGVGSIFPVDNGNEIIELISLNDMYKSIGVTAADSLLEAISNISLGMIEDFV